MTNEETRQWLRVHKVRLLVQWTAGAFLGLLLSLVLLACAWGLVYAVCVMIFHAWSVDFIGRTSFIVATASIPCLFLGNLFVQNDDLTPGKNCVTTGTMNDEIVSDGMGHSNINPIAPNTVITIVKVLLDFLFVGPRLVFWSFRLAARSLQLCKLDIPRCATAITLLYNSAHRLAHEDIMQATEIPRYARLLQELKLLDAVHLLESQPQGLVLSSALRETLKTHHNHNANSNLACPPPRPHDITFQNIKRP